MRIDGNVAAVVTGGASGLGEASARALAQAGARVAIFDMHEAQGAAVAQEIGGIFCQIDVTSDEQVDAAFAKARKAHGQERVLVNCAGIANGIKTASRNKQDMMRDLPENVQVALGASVPFPKRLGAPEEYAALALHMIGNSYLNGESVRLDGAIRLAPR